MRNKYTDRLIARAERDDQFRARLQSDPKAAIGEELGVEVPESLNVRVVEEGADEVILVLPPKATPGALREEELAGVAGGSGSGWCGSCDPNNRCGGFPIL